MLHKEWWWYHTFRDDDTLEVWDEAIKAARTPQERRKIQMEIDDYYIWLKSNKGEDVSADAAEFNRLYYPKGGPHRKMTKKEANQTGKKLDRYMAKMQRMTEEEAAEDKAGLQLQWDLMKARMTP
jgi:hypothetical protein